MSCNNILILAVFKLSEQILIFCQTIQNFVNSSILIILTLKLQFGFVFHGVCILNVSFALFFYYYFLLKSHLSRIIYTPVLQHNDEKYVMRVPDITL